MSNAIALVMGMFGTEFNTKEKMGLSCGQMRPIEHNCEECGLNHRWGSRASGPVCRTREHRQHPLAWCECKVDFRPRCEKITHNSGWYNSKGEKVGWGDLCVCDFHRIAKMCAEPFYILSESASFWNFAEHERERHGIAPNAPMNAPGITYVRKHALWVIKPDGKLPMFQNYQVDQHGYHLKGPGLHTTKSYGALTYTQIHHLDLQGLGL